MTTTTRSKANASLRPRRGRLLQTGMAVVLFTSATTMAIPVSFAETASIPASNVAPPDPWFGPDKALHFGVSFAVASSGYALGAATTDTRWVGVLVGAGLSLSLGGAKEALDATGLGDASIRDFAWDVVGTALGLGVSLAFDAALRGPSP